MRTSEVPKETSRIFSDNLTSVCEIINAYRNRVNSEDVRADIGKSKNIPDITTSAVLIIISGLYADLYFLPHSNSTEEIRLALQLVVVLIYIMVNVVILLLRYTSIKEIYKDFTGQIIGFAADAVKNGAPLFESLKDLSTQTIVYLANRLEQDSTQLGQIRGFLLGAIYRIGIISGLFATVIAICKVADSTGISWVELLSVLMLGVYMSMSIRTKRVGQVISLDLCPNVLNSAN